MVADVRLDFVLKTQDAYCIWGEKLRKLREICREMCVGFAFGPTTSVHISLKSS